MTDTRQIYSVWYTEHYEVTHEGRVFSHKTGAPYELKQDDFAGYKKLALTIERKIQNWRVHRLVATCFHGLAPTDKHVARHLDGVRHNNHYTNIRWGTQIENKQDDLHNGARARQAEKMRALMPELWTPQRKAQQALVLTKSRQKVDHSAKNKQTWLNATPEQRAQWLDRLDHARQSRNWADAVRTRVSQSNTTRWQTWTPEQRQHAADMLEAARQIQLEKRRARKAAELEKINTGRTRPYLDAGHNNGPQLDLFNDDENKTER